MNEITKLKIQNNRRAQKIKALKTVINDFADRFNNVSDYEDTLTIVGEDENGECHGLEQAIYGDKLDELYDLINDFIDFAGEIK